MATFQNNKKKDRCSHETWLVFVIDNVFKDGSRNSAIFKMELFATISNGRVYNQWTVLFACCCGKLTIFTAKIKIRWQWPWLEVFQGFINRSNHMQNSYLAKHLGMLDSTHKQKVFIQCLKLVSTIFYQIFIFSPNDSPSKTMKNVFYFIKKALFVLEIFKFL